MSNYVDKFKKKGYRWIPKNIRPILSGLFSIIYGLGISIYHLWVESRSNRLFYGLFGVIWVFGVVYQSIYARFGCFLSLPVMIWFMSMPSSSRDSRFFFALRCFGCFGMYVYPSWRKLIRGAYLRLVGRRLVDGWVCATYLHIFF